MDNLFTVQKVDEMINQIEIYLNIPKELKEDSDNEPEKKDECFERCDELIVEYIKMSVDPKQNPIYPKLPEIVTNLGDLSGKLCVDLGCGPGIMLPLLSNAVGKNGKIYGIDIDPGFLNYAALNVVPRLNNENITIIHSLPFDMCISNDLKGKINIFLLAFVVNYLQEKANYKKIIPQIGEYLSNEENAEIVVIDFDQTFVDVTFGSSEPAEDDPNDWKYLEAEQIEKLFNEFGFVLDRYILKDVVPHHHCIVFKKDPKKNAF